MGLPCRARDLKQRVNGKCRKRCLPSLQHYLLTRGLGFLGLHWRLTIDYYNWKTIFYNNFFNNIV